jgi:hypothetical protein
MTDAQCEAGVGAGTACTLASTPGAWETTPWAIPEATMDHCSTYWVLTTPPLAAGSWCYKFYGDDGAGHQVWFDDKGPDAVCGTGAAFCNPSSGDNCTVNVP